MFWVFITLSIVYSERIIFRLRILFFIWNVRLAEEINHISEICVEFDRKGNNLANGVEI